MLHEKPHLRTATDPHKTMIYKVMLGFDSSAASPAVGLIMAKIDPPSRKNSSTSASVKAVVSIQSKRLIEKLVAVGIFGRTRSEVAGRLIEDGLRRHIHPVRFQIDGDTFEVEPAKENDASEK